MKIFGISIHCEEEKCNFSQKEIKAGPNDADAVAISSIIAEAASEVGCPKCAEHNVTVVVTDVVELLRQRRESSTEEGD